MRYLLLVISMASLISCSRVSDEEISYEALKKKPFKTMTTSEKQELTSELIIKLKSDKNFKFMDNQRNLMAIQWLTRNKIHDNKLKTPKLISKKQMVDYFKGRGLKNPSMYYKRHIVTILSLAMLKKDYPELFAMDKAERGRVFKSCSVPLSKENAAYIVTQLKMKIK